MENIGGKVKEGKHGMRRYNIHLSRIMESNNRENEGDACPKL